MQADHPLVTIILPVYNGEKTLQLTLASLIDQTFADFEILIGIDGTKDGSRKIAESFQDHRITIIENPTNIGLGPNVNNLISLTNSNSEFIAMAEQDDIYAPERLQWQIEYLQKHKEVGLVSGIAEFVSDSNKVMFPGILLKGKQFPQGEKLFKYLYINQLKVVNTCMMFRKAVHELNHFSFTNTYGNHNVDWDYILRFSLVSKVHGLHKKLVIMNRKSQFNSVTTNKRKQHQMSRKILSDIKNEFPKIISNKTYRKALKMQRKIELGHRSKPGIIFYGIGYFILYQDPYFIKYILFRISKFRNKTELTTS